MDMFLDKLSRLKLERKVEFSIEEALRITSIFKTPFIIVPTELYELKKQLQKLLNNGFIILSHPS